MAKKVLLLAGVMLLILLVASAVLWINVNRMLLPVDAGAVDEIVEVTITPGSGTAQIAVVLTEKGIIHNPAIFRIYARWHKLDTLFIAGTYHLSPSMSLEQVAAKLAGGEVHRDTAWFTIPEGFTVEQIADRLAGRGLADRERFLELAANPPESFFESFPFLGEFDFASIRSITGAGWQRGHPPLLLEGYLFPDTYEVKAGTTEEEIIVMMLARMQAVHDEEYSRETITDSRALAMSMHQVLTLASIVEKEAGIPGDIETIGAIFHYRLDTPGWLLESCVTVGYFLDVNPWRITFAQRDTPSPYNTYLNAGLPPGPIASPGRAAIRSVLFPVETEYRFFCSLGDGSGESLFARTLAEHGDNQLIMEENMKKQNR